MTRQLRASLSMSAAYELPARSSIVTQMNRGDLPLHPWRFTPTIPPSEFLANKLPEIETHRVSVSSSLIGATEVHVSSLTFQPADHLAASFAGSLVAQIVDSARAGFGRSESKVWVRRGTIAMYRNALEHHARMEDVQHMEALQEEAVRLTGECFSFIAQNIADLVLDRGQGATMTATVAQLLDIIPRMIEEAIIEHFTPRNAVGDRELLNDTQLAILRITFLRTARRAVDRPAFMTRVFSQCFDRLHRQSQPLVLDPPIDSRTAVQQSAQHFGEGHATLFEILHAGSHATDAAADASVTSAMLLLAAATEARLDLSASPIAKNGLVKIMVCDLSVKVKQSSKKKTRLTTATTQQSNNSKRKVPPVEEVCMLCCIRSANTESTMMPATRSHSC